MTTTVPLSTLTREEWLKVADQLEKFAGTIEDPYFKEMYRREAARIRAEHPIKEGVGV